MLWFTCFCVCAQQNFHVTSQTADFPPDEVIVDSPKLSIDDNYNLSLAWMEINFSKAEGTNISQSIPIQSPLSFKVSLPGNPKIVPCSFLYLNSFST